MRTAIRRSAMLAVALSIVSSCTDPAAISDPTALKESARAGGSARALTGAYSVDSVLLETRYWNSTGPLPTTATAAAVFNGLPTNVPGYTNAPWLMPGLAGTITSVTVVDPFYTDTVWGGIRNPAGSHANVATRYRARITAKKASQLMIEFGVDFLGGAMYVDGSPVAENWNNPWWGGRFDADTNSIDATCSPYGTYPCVAMSGPSPDLLSATVNLTSGTHWIEVIGFENGDDAGAAARIDVGNGFQDLVNSVQPAQTLSVTRPGAGTGTVTSSPTGINCTSACSASFPLGTVVTLTATPTSGSIFTGWTGACSGTGACSVPMFLAQTVGATFVAPPAVTDMSIETRYWNGASFTKTAAGAMTFFDGLPTNVAGYTNEPVPVTTLVQNASLFTAPAVGANGQLASRYVIHVNVPVTVNVSFRFSADMGGGGAMLLDGAEFAAAWSGSAGGPLFEVPTVLTAGQHTIQIVGFEDCCDGAVPRLEYNVGSGWITATAPPPPPTPLFVAIPSSGGTVTSSPAGINCGATCQANFATGSQVTLTATPSPYVVFDSWGGACSGTSPTCSVRMLSPSRSVTASFVRTAWPVSVTTGGSGGGTVTASPAGTSCGVNCLLFAPGTTVTFTAAPDANSTFIGWNIAGCTGPTCTVTVNSALAIVAQFQTNLDHTPPAISCSANPKELWPVNHKLADIKISVVATDAGTGVAGWSLVSVTSSEAANATSDGNTSTDILGWTIGAADTTGQLRAERAGALRDRVYTFTYRAVDVAGNAATAQCTVVVPHDK